MESIANEAGVQSHLKALAGTGKLKTKMRGLDRWEWSRHSCRTYLPDLILSVPYSKPFSIPLHFPRINLPPIARLAGILSLSPLPPGHSASDVSVGA